VVPPTIDDPASLEEIKSMLAGVVSSDVPARKRDNT
jgi:hypothetical protein